MGAVYRAKDTRLGRDVAIKILTALTLSDQERVQRFEQEARATGMLNHPNLLTIYDVGNENGTAYIVSELLEGETLRERLERGPLAARRAVDAALQVANGLAAAHEKGVIHRDLKPDNIFLTRDGRAKIFAGFEFAEVDGGQLQAVRGMAEEIGLDEPGGDDLRLVAIAARGGEGVPGRGSSQPDRHVQVPARRDLARKVQRQVERGHQGLHDQRPAHHQGHRRQHIWQHLGAGVMRAVFIADHAADGHLAVGRHPPALILLVEESIHALKHAFGDARRLAEPDRRTDH